MRRFRGVLPAAMLLSLTAAAQSPQNTVPYTLHVYTDLVQIPTLVLGPSRETLPLIDAQKFNISLDSGPLFRPTHVRLEGDDPITLAILLDVSIDQKNLPPTLSKDIANLVPGSLHPKDHVSIYALDCNLIRSADDIPADAGEIEHSINAVLQSPKPHGKNMHSTCEDSVQLWGALGEIARQLSSLPGRRVILTISSGYDGGGGLKWAELKRFATSESVAIFGLSIPSYDATLRNKFAGSENPFNIICQQTGGLILQLHGKELSQALNRFVDLVRGRYILEFPRPANATGGEHNIAVTLDKTKAFIRPSGISIPLPDPAIRTDPTTVPSDPSRAPQMGKRRALTPQ
jgi:hypothetical protein